MDPFNSAVLGESQGVGEAIEAVADDAVDASHASGDEGFDHLVGDGFGHRRSSEET